MYVGSGRSESEKDPSSSSGSSGHGPKDVEPRTIKFEYKIPNFDPQNWNYWLPLGLAVTAGYLLTRPSMNSRRISWQEFRVNYLEKGEVDRLEVVDKNVVKVYLRRDAGSGPGVSYNIGGGGGGGGGFGGNDLSYHRANLRSLILTNAGPVLRNFRGRPRGGGLDTPV